jgi:ketosteroid isomerase-like protein
MRRILPAVLLLVAAASPRAAASPTNAELREQVRQTESAFAKTMADRDHAAFASFLAEETIFFGPGNVLRGKQQVVDGWKRFYTGDKAPFSWAPERVEVIDSGTLGMSQGPVYDPDGKRVGTFNSVWRRETDGRWKIVLDNGCPPCDCAPRTPATTDLAREPEGPRSSRGHVGQR